VRLRAISSHGSKAIYDNPKKDLAKMPEWTPGRSHCPPDVLKLGPWTHAFLLSKMT
jgi:hypothetical protein